MIQWVGNKSSVMRRNTEAGGRVAERTMEGTLQLGKGWPRNASLISEGGEGVSHEDNAGTVSRQAGEASWKVRGLMRWEP